jgi:hypothetical protein
VILDKKARRIKKGVNGNSYGTQRSRGQSCNKCRKQKVSSHAPYPSQYQLLQRRCIHNELGEIDPSRVNPPPPPPFRRSPIYPQTTFTAPTPERSSFISKATSQAPEVQGDYRNRSFDKANQVQSHDAVNRVLTEQNSEGIQVVSSQKEPPSSSPQTSFGVPTLLQMQAPTQNQSPQLTPTALHSPRGLYGHYSSLYRGFAPPSRTPSQNSDLGFSLQSDPFASPNSRLHPPPPPSYSTHTVQPKRPGLASYVPGKLIGEEPVHPAALRQTPINSIAKASTGTDGSNFQEPSRRILDGNARQAERMESTKTIASPEWVAPTTPSPSVSGTVDQPTTVPASIIPLTNTKPPIVPRTPMVIRPLGRPAIKSPTKSTSTPAPTGKQHGAHAPQKASPPVQDAKLRDALRKTAAQAPGKQSTAAAIQLPLVIPDMYPSLPCMDCGEDTGHKADCHLGSKASPIPNVPRD